MAVTSQTAEFLKGGYGPYRCTGPASSEDLFAIFMAGKVNRRKRLSMIENVEFSSEEEIKRELSKADGTSSGPVLFMDWETGEPYVSGSESNAIFLGVTGCGKTRRGTIPMTMSMIQAEESFLSVDPKGDIFASTYGLAKQRGYYIKVFDFRDLTRSDGFDLFGYAYENYKSSNPSDKQMGIETLRNIADCIYGDSERIHAQRDPFWDSSAKSFFTAVMYMLFEYGTPDHIHPDGLIKIASDLFARLGPIRYLDKMCELFPNAPFTRLLGNVRSAPTDTLGSIKSSFFEPLNTFMTSTAITELMSDASFKMSELDGKKKVAIYIILPDENKNYSTLASIILAQIVSHHIRIAHTKYDGRLPRRMNVVIEELGNIGGSLPMLDCLMTAGRSRNIRTFFVIQSFSQLDTLYGRSKASTILANADTLIAYRTNELNTLRELSSKCGLKVDNDADTVEPLVTPTQLGSLNNGEVLVLKSGRLKYITQLPDFTEIITLKDLPKAVHVPERGAIKKKRPALHPFVAEVMNRNMEAEEKKKNEKADKIIKDIQDTINSLGLKDDEEEEKAPAPKHWAYTPWKHDPDLFKPISEERVTLYEQIRKYKYAQMLATALKMAADKKAEEERMRKDVAGKIAHAMHQVADAKAAEEASAEKPPEKRKRGRPKKAVTAEAAAETSASAPPEKKKRGRPRKTAISEVPKETSSGPSDKAAGYSVIIDISDTPEKEHYDLFRMCIRHSVRSSASLPSLIENSKLVSFFKDYESARAFSKLIRARFTSIRNVTIEVTRRAS